MVRAKALTTGTAAGTTDSTFWQASAEQAVRCLLHAAALGGCTAADLYRWSLSAVQAREAVLILATDTRTRRRPGTRRSTRSSTPTRGSGTRSGRWCPSRSPPWPTRRSSTPSPRAAGEHFDPEQFLRHNGTVYLLGTSTGVAATAGLVGAFVEDVVEAARRHRRPLPRLPARPAAVADPRRGRATTRCRRCRR